jgi:hypothetical protein
MVRAVRAPIQRMRAATEIPVRQTIARAVRVLRCALAESNKRTSGKWTQQCNWQANSHLKREV